jgi:hypothetical protein
MSQQLIKWNRVKIRISFSHWKVLDIEVISNVIHGRYYGDGADRFIGTFTTVTDR